MGYDNSLKTLIVRNSWGTSGGKQGYFTLPHAYLENAKLVSEMYTALLVA